MSARCCNTADGASESFSTGPTSSASHSTSTATAQNTTANKNVWLVSGKPNRPPSSTNAPIVQQPRGTSSQAFATRTPLDGPRSALSKPHQVTMRAATPQPSLPQHATQNDQRQRLSTLFSTTSHPTAATVGASSPLAAGPIHHTAMASNKPGPPPKVVLANMTSARGSSVVPKTTMNEHATRKIDHLNVKSGSQLFTGGDAHQTPSAWVTVPVPDASGGLQFRPRGFSETASSARIASEEDSTPWDLKERYLVAERTGPTETPDYLLAKHKLFPKGTNAFISPYSLFYLDETAPNPILLENDAKEDKAPLRDQKSGRRLTRPGAIVPKRKVSSGSEGQSTTYSATADSAEELPQLGVARAVTTSIQSYSGPAGSSPDGATYGLPTTGGSYAGPEGSYRGPRPREQSSTKSRSFVSVAAAPRVGNDGGCCGAPAAPSIGGNASNFDRQSLMSNIKYEASKPQDYVRVVTLSRDGPSSSNSTSSSESAGPLGNLRYQMASSAQYATTVEELPPSYPPQPPSLGATSTGNGSSLSRPLRQRRACCGVGRNRGVDDSFDDEDDDDDFTSDSSITSSTTSRDHRVSSSVALNRPLAGTHQHGRTRVSVEATSSDLTSTISSRDLRPSRGPICGVCRHQGGRRDDTTTEDDRTSNDTLTDHSRKVKRQSDEISSMTHSVASARIKQQRRKGGGSRDARGRGKSSSATSNRPLPPVAEEEPSDNQTLYSSCFEDGAPPVKPSAKRESERDTSFNIRKMYFDIEDMRLPNQGTGLKMLPGYSVSYRNYPVICYDVIAPRNYTEFFQTRKTPVTDLIHKLSNEPMMQPDSILDPNSFDDPFNDRYIRAQIPLVLPPRNKSEVVNDIINERPLSKRAKRKIEQLEKKANSKRQRIQVQRKLRAVTLSDTDKEVLSLLHLVRSGQSDNHAFLHAYRKLTEDFHLALTDQAVVARANRLKAIAQIRSNEADEKAAGTEESTTPDSRPTDGSKIQGSNLPTGNSAALTQPSSSPVASRRDSEERKVVNPSSKTELTDLMSDKNSCEVAGLDCQKDSHRVKKVISEKEMISKTPQSTASQTWKQGLPRETIERSRDIEMVRMSLPAVGMESEIVDAVLENDCILITGETGSGKSTQIPQFLYEAGFTVNGRYKIGITEPRRVATYGVANRLAEELGHTHGQYVGYQVRHECAVDADCRILVMTDGILLQRMKSDFLLRTFSVIVLDEIHERSINCDVLLGLLSRCVRLRARLKLPPLTLVLMSATLQVSDFHGGLFSAPPGRINIPAKTHPVTIHFSKTTPTDYVAETRKKILQIHRKLPAGSILAFLTGKQEIIDLAASLTKKKRKGKHASIEGGSQTPLDGTDDDSTCSSDSDNESDEEPDSPMIDDESNEPSSKGLFTLKGCEDADDPIMPSTKTITWLGANQSAGKLRVLPLYANLSPAKQRRVFDPPQSAKERIVILATNVAETSITLPNIRYVIDSGFEKRRVWSTTGALSAFQVSVISQANAAQRAGRAGRVGPGHCYRLYSSAVFQHEFPPHPTEELLSAPLDSTVLLLASLGLPLKVLKSFPFPKHPPEGALVSAISRLQMLGLFSGEGTEAVLSDLGQLVARIPLPPRYACMVVRGLLGAQHAKTYRLLPYIVLGACALSVSVDLFPPSRDHEKANKDLPLKPRDDLEGYLLLLLSVLNQKTAADREYRSKALQLVYPKVMEIIQSSQQIMDLIKKELPEGGKAEWRDWYTLSCLKGPDLRSVRFCISLGLKDQIAIRFKKTKLAPQLTEVNYREYRRFQKAWKVKQTVNKAFLSKGSFLFPRRPWPDAVLYNHANKQKGDDYILNDLILIEDASLLGIKDELEDALDL